MFIPVHATNSIRKLNFHPKKISSIISVAYIQLQFIGLRCSAAETIPAISVNKQAVFSKRQSVRKSSVEILSWLGDKGWTVSIDRRICSPGVRRNENDPRRRPTATRPHKNLRKFVQPGIGERPLPARERAREGGMEGRRFRARSGVESSVSRAARATSPSKWILIYLRILFAIRGSGRSFSGPGS